MNDKNIIKFLAVAFVLSSAEYASNYCFRCEHDKCPKTCTQINSSADNIEKDYSTSTPNGECYPVGISATSATGTMEIKILDLWD